MRGTVTDLLIGDLFDDRVDKVWGPMESLYQPGKSRIQEWTRGDAGGSGADKANELILPEGGRGRDDRTEETESGKSKKE